MLAVLLPPRCCICPDRPNARFCADLSRPPGGGGQSMYVFSSGPHGLACSTLPSRYRLIAAATCAHGQRRKRRKRCAVREGTDRVRCRRHRSKVALEGKGIHDGETPGRGTAWERHHHQQGRVLPAGRDNSNSLACFLRQVLFLVVRLYIRQTTAQRSFEETRKLPASVRVRLAPRNAADGRTWP